MVPHPTETSQGQVVASRLEPIVVSGFLMSQEPTTGKAVASTSGQVMVLTGIDQREMEGSKANDTLHLSSEDLSITIAKRRDELPWLTSENCLIQRSLISFVTRCGCMLRMF